MKTNKFSENLKEFYDDYKIIWSNDKDMFRAFVPTFFIICFLIVFTLLMCSCSSVKGRYFKYYNQNPNAFNNVDSTVILNKPTYTIKAEELLVVKQNKWLYFYKPDSLSLFGTYEIKDNKIILINNYKKLQIGFIYNIKKDTLYMENNNNFIYIKN